MELRGRALAKRTQGPVFNPSTAEEKSLVLFMFFTYDHQLHMKGDQRGGKKNNVLRTHFNCRKCLKLPASEDAYSMRIQPQLL